MQRLTPHVPATGPAKTGSRMELSSSGREAQRVLNLFLSTGACIATVAKDDSALHHQAAVVVVLCHPWADNFTGTAPRRRAKEGWSRGSVPQAAPFPPQLN